MLESEFDELVKKLRDQTISVGDKAYIPMDVFQEVLLMYQMEFIELKTMLSQMKRGF